MSTNDFTTHIDHITALNINTSAHGQKCTGIVCTIGPVSRAVETLTSMINAGMNVVRLNFSHGSHEYHAGTIKNAREAIASFGTPLKPIAIALDTKGPEIRTGLLEGGASAELVLTVGSKINLVTNESFAEKCSLENLYLDYKNITRVVKPGNLIFIDDGLISLKALSVDMVFASFIRDAQGVHEIRKVLGEKGKNILIIPKIENHQGIENIDEIIAASDGIMVARGDMGIEIPPEKVFLAQKMIIGKTNIAGKPCICATQMLESMVGNPRPTRAEGSDVANAVLDGADCTMLSGETAKGKYALEAVTIMAKINKEAESAIYHKQLFDDILSKCKKPVSAPESIAIAASQVSFEAKCKAIICLTSTGSTATLLSKYRPQCPILAVTRVYKVACQLQLFRSVFPIYIETARDSDWIKDVDARIHLAIDYALKNGMACKGDSVIVVSGWKSGPGSTNTMRIVTI